MSIRDLQIVPAHYGHLDELCLIMKYLYPPALWGIEEFKWTERSSIRENLRLFSVVLYNGNVVGAICLRHLLCGLESEVEALVVIPEYQGCGLGKLLIDFAKSSVRMNGGNLLTLGTFSAYDKVGYYERQGFVDKGTSYYWPAKYGEQFPYHTMVANV